MSSIESSQMKPNTYVSIEKGVYALQRDYSASTRLTAQHYLWKDTLRFNLHPDIHIDKTHARIADVATGNGIWLLDVAKELPQTATFDGFDISLDQCPPQVWLPANTNLHTWNVFEEPPKEFVEVFDVVHIRLITVAVRNNDPRPILSNLRRILKPGGYIQWDVADSVDWSIESIDPSIDTTFIKESFQQLCGDHDWKRNMVQTFNENGFQESSAYRVEYSHTMARFWNDVYMSTWDEFARVVLKTPEESQRLASAAMDQVREGAAIWCPKLVWVARKV